MSEEQQVAFEVREVGYQEAKMDASQIDLFIMYTEEGVPDLIVDGCEPPCGCWGFELRTSGKAVSVLNL
ncbi:hypothetical protein STEG23_035664 [Scotinomys teguina]